MGSSLVNVKSARQACRLEPQAGADPAVLRQNFFLLQEASGFALQAFDWTRPLQCGGWSPLLKFWWRMKHHPQNTFMATSGWVFGWITGDWPSQADTGTDHHCTCQAFCFAKSQHLYCYYCLLQSTWVYIEVHYIWGAMSSREKGVSFKDINSLDALPWPVIIWGMGLGTDLSRKDRLHILELFRPPS